jgi:hypothetical protein
MKAMQWPRGNLLEQRLDGTVVLEHGEPRREAIVQAFERAGYLQAEEAPAPDVVGYRQAATPSLSLRFVARSRKGNNAVRSIRIWRADAGTMAYTVVCAPFWLLQAAGIVAGLVSLVAAAFGDHAHHPWVPGLIAAGVLLGLPKLWIDDARQLLREAIEAAREGEPAGEVPAEAVPAGQSKARGSPVPQPVRVATDSPALAAAAKTARDAVVRHETEDPADAVEELERAARRGGRDD